MRINRQNYEELFLLYVDNELTPGQRSEVEEFVHHNPDLTNEFNELKQAVMLPDCSMQFTDKGQLFKKEEGINISNCEEYFLLYVDNELSAIDRKAVEVFVLHNPQTQPAFTLLKSTKLEPEAISYVNNADLYRNEKERVVPIVWMRIAVAAAILGVVALLYSVIPENTTNTGKETIALKSSEAAPSSQPVRKVPSSVVIKDHKVNEAGGTQDFQKPTVAMNRPGAQKKEAELERSLNNTDKPVLVAESLKNISPATKTNNLPERIIEKDIAALNLTLHNIEIEQPNEEPGINRRVKSANADTNNSVNTFSKSGDQGKEAELFKQAVYREADTFNEEENSFLIGSARINKNKLRGLLKKATGFLDKRIDRDEDDK